MSAQPEKIGIVNPNTEVEIFTSASTIESTAIQQPTTSSNCTSKTQRKHNSPDSSGHLIETFAEPLSPASSSSASQTNGGDSTFEPSIDMMVNDFDDEQTLTEEEALAELESQNPHDEIATLQEESEMPLEELLAKYRHMEEEEIFNNKKQIPPPEKKKVKKSSLKKPPKKKKFSKIADVVSENSIETIERGDDLALIETDDEDAGGKDENNSDGDIAIEKKQEELVNEDNSSVAIECVESHVPTISPAAIENAPLVNQQPQPRRTHLMELYPENFSHIVRQKHGDNDGGDYDNSYEQDDEEEEEDDEDFEYMKKTVMVGSTYQAVIPVGLSKYGDMLPYENEDKLIWEPSQVSEKQVEDYLLKAREIRPLLSEDEQVEGLEVQNVSMEMTTDNEANDNPATLSTGLGVTTGLCNTMTSSNVITDTDLPENSSSVKDNEQALHLLVQCGYDFKEALRRKRLNALPLTGSMSLWSEEECQKFEEGIQKYGKDFLKIRQTQVRTRSMRELVQFYYLWKKTERRDQDFADSDTVDHMDMYLNEGEYNSSSSSNVGNSCSSAANAKVQSPGMILLTSNKIPQSDSAISTFQNKKLNTSSVPTQKNFSIMNESKRQISPGSTVQTSGASPVNSSTVSNNSISTKKASGNQNQSTVPSKTANRKRVSTSSAANKINSY